MKKLAFQKKQILVQGHTDNQPIKNEYFYSNWELSTARATTVTEYLINDHGYPAPCMAAVGFGEHQPECKEDTPACRQKNRRVVFLIRNPGMTKGACGEIVTPPEYAVPDAKAEGTGKAASSAEKEEEKP